MTKKAPIAQPHIFLDLDGVLADYDLHAETQGKRAPDGTMKWDELDHEWWVTMPAYPGAKEFYEATLKMGITRFLSAPSMSADCFSGKADWVQNFSSKGKFALRDLILCAAKDKHFFAKPNHILIDDRESNIQEWVAAGGIGILHKGDFKATMKALELAIEKLAITGRPSAPQKSPHRASKSPRTPGL